MSELPAPSDLLPHRTPFLLVDEMTSIVPGESASGIWRLTGDEYFFRGHFPGRPTLPGVLMCEAIAQVGAAAVLADERGMTARSLECRERAMEIQYDSLDDLDRVLDLLGVSVDN